MNSGRAEKNAHVRANAFFLSNRIHVAGAAPRMRTARRANAKPGARVNDATAPHTKHTKNLRNAKKSCGKKHKIVAQIVLGGGA